MFRRLCLFALVVCSWLPGEAEGYDLNYSTGTFLGGSGLDRPTLGCGLVGDGAGGIIVSGYTDSLDFPSTNGAPEGGDDAFVTRFDANGVPVWSTRFGGDGLDRPRCITLGPGGTVWATGITESSEFLGLPVAGTRDGFVIELDLATGTVGQFFLVGGSGEDQGHALGFDGSDRLTLLGNTGSTNLVPAPTADAFDSTYNGGPRDIFIMRWEFPIVPAAALYSSYLGGNGTEHALDMILSPGGVITSCGDTSSTDLPVTPNAVVSSYSGGPRDAQVFRLDPSQSPAEQLEYMTYFGGTELDQATSIALDAASRVLVASFGVASGFQPSPPPPSPGGTDCVLLRFDAGWNVDWSTYLGGASNDRPRYIQVLENEQILIAGLTSSANFPVTAEALDDELETVSCAAGIQDGFLTFLDPGAVFDPILYSTYLGGCGFDTIRGVRVESTRLWVFGLAWSPDFPGTSGGHSGGNDTVLLGLDLLTERFRRGDCNLVDGMDLVDVIFLLQWLFSGGPSGLCEDACDANDDGSLDIIDAIYTLSALFLGGPPPGPPGPGPECGCDPTSDALDCGAPPCP